MGVDPMTSTAEATERRDFLYIATGATGAVTAAVATWPLIDALNPSRDVTALATVDIDVSGMEPGTRITFKWRGKPIFVDRRTPAQIAQARADDAADLPHAETDGERTQRAEWLVVIGVCTHLGCIPLGQSSSDPLGEWGGWFCPCHGSHYDTSGRIRKGPAPRNLDVPPYRFVSDTVLRIG